MMRWFPLLGLAPLLLAAEEPAAGVLASVTGTVTVTYPSSRIAKAHVFDWLKVGASISDGYGLKSTSRSGEWREV
jgi:hypothetical protein